MYFLIKGQQKSESHMQKPLCQWQTIAVASKNGGWVLKDFQSGKD